MSQNSDFPRANVLGVGVSAINLSQAAQILLDTAYRNQRGYVCVTGVHGISEAQIDPQFRKILNNAFLNTPDGMPMSWIGWIQGHRDMDRVYGPDLMLDLSDAGRVHELRHFYYGGKEGVAKQLKQKMEARFPGLKVVGTYTPPFRPLNANEENSLIRQLKKTRPHFLWVGLSTPKQEQFMARYFDRLPVNILLGVGAAFDMHAGLVAQAPRWIQRLGLEWLFRLCTEPRRLWKRYCINNPLFIARITSQLLGLRKYPLSNDQQPLNPTQQ